MSVYVDQPFEWEAKERQAHRAGARHGHQWCHLWADTLEELHAMARKVGMKREWFQDKPGFPHYDLVPTKRARALQLGAIEKDLIERCREKRKADADLPFPTEGMTPEQIDYWRRWAKSAKPIRDLFDAVEVKL